MSYRLLKLSQNDYLDWKKYQRICFNDDISFDPRPGVHHFKYKNMKTGEIVGYCTIQSDHLLSKFTQYGLSQSDTNLSMMVNSIWNVCSTKKEKGICKKMIRSVLKKYHSLPMTLAVYKTNEPAIKCYESCGFTYILNKNRNSDAYFMIY